MTFPIGVLTTGGGLSAGSTYRPPFAAWTVSSCWMAMKVIKTAMEVHMFALMIA